MKPKRRTKKELYSCRSKTFGFWAGGFIFETFGGVPIIRNFFTITMILLFSLYGCLDQIDPRLKFPTGPGPDPDSPLINTGWFWDGGWGEVKLYFESAEKVLFNGQERFDYSFDKTTLSGQADSLGNFTVTENYTQMIFSPVWRGYPHGALFTRLNK